MIVGAGIAGPAGYVTSAAYAHTLATPVACAWLPAGLPAGSPVETQYFDRRVRASVAAEPLVDPEMTWIRR